MKTVLEKLKEKEIKNTWAITGGQGGDTTDDDLEQEDDRDREK